MANEHGRWDCLEGNCQGMMLKSSEFELEGGYGKERVHPCSVCGRLYWHGGVAVFRNREPVYLRDIGVDVEVKAGGLITYNIYVVWPSGIIY